VTRPEGAPPGPAGVFGAPIETRTAAPNSVAPVAAPAPAEAPARSRAVPRSVAPKASSDNTVSRRDLWGRKQRFEARKVRRLVRHVDPWSVLKLSLIFFFCLWIMFLIAAVIVWSVAESSGTVGKIESFVSDLGLTDWKLDGKVIFRQFGLVGLVLMFAMTAAATITSIVFNLVSDIIGGVWITVIEEETSRPVSG